MKTGRRIILFLGLSLLLSGCITQQTETVIRPDGSGTQVFRIGISQQFLDLAGMGGQGSIDPTDALSDIGTGTAELPAEWQATNEPWESTDRQYEGAQISMQFRDLAMLEDQLMESALGSSNSLVIFDDVSVSEEDGSYVIRATVASATGTEELGLGSEFGDLQGGAFGNVVPTASWRIEMPGEITEWSEQELATQEGNAVTYSFPFPLDRPYEIVVRAKVKPGISLQVMLIVVGMLVLGLATILAGVVLNRRNRRVAAQPIPPTGPLAPPPGVWNAPVPAQYAPPSAPIAPPGPAQYAPPSAPIAPPGPPADPYYTPGMPTRALGGWMEPNQRPDETRDETRD
ncbi:MAG: hypothetical protein H0T53_13455 [Herpetosiphonaceae bacterium]|nr:hypothetical protein [Herpetosiphonaceae bacterium]